MFPVSVGIPLYSDEAEKFTGHQVRLAGSTGLLGVTRRKPVWSDNKSENKYTHWLDTGLRRDINGAVSAVLRDSTRDSIGYSNGKAPSDMQKKGAP